MSIWKLTDSEPVKIDGNVDRASAGHMQDGFSELLTRADALVADSQFLKAFDIYRRLLARDSSNKYLRQRFEELKSLILILGMRQDLVVFRLGKFLEAIVAKRSRQTG